MELTLKINTESKHDLKMVSAVAVALGAVGELEASLTPDSTEKEQDKVVVETEETEAPVTPVEEETKPKRRRKKVEETKTEEPAVENPVEEQPVKEEPVVETPAEEPIAEETTGELPFDAETEETKEISEDEWTNILIAKRDELKLGGENSSLKTKFNALVKEKSLEYGADLPKKLTATQRYKFVHEVFNNIRLDQEKGEFYVMPF